jgi:hypothetical protein
MRVNKQKIFYTAVLLFLSSCASKTKPDYRFLIGGRYEAYTENQTVPLDQTLATSLGGTVTATSGNPNQITTRAAGGQIGFVEEYKHLTTTISAFYNSYSAIKYTFNSSNYGVIYETLAPTGAGLDVTIGFNLTTGDFKIRPEVSYKYESQTFTTTVSGGGLPAPIVTKTTQALFVWGGGLALEFPFIDESKLVFQGDYRVPSKGSPGVSSSNFVSGQVNLLFGTL